MDAGGILFSFELTISIPLNSGNKMSYIRVLILLLPLMFLTSCNLTDQTPSNIDRLGLYIIDTSTKEVYLRIKPNNRFREGFVTLQRNNFPIMTFSSSKDTVVCDTSLVPNTGYTYMITENESPFSRKLSEKVTARTLGTTSHNVSWQMFYMGWSLVDEPMDVVIIDENDIWISGRFTRTEAGEEKFYNLIKWDGSNWTYDVAKNESEGYYYGDGYSLFALSKNEVWEGNSVPGLWNGEKWKYFGVEKGYPKPTAWIRKIWGSGSTDMYFAGEDGSIVKYNGTRFSLLNEGSAGLTADMYGYKDEVTGEKVVYCPYAVHDDPRLSKVIRISGSSSGIDNIDFIRKDGGIRPVTVWTHRGYPVYVGGEGLYYFTPGRWKDAGMRVNKFIYKVRGTGLNDIFAAGAWGLLAHYNGSEWMTYPEFTDKWDDISLLDVKGNTIAAVGTYNGQVAVAIGKRN